MENLEILKPAIFSEEIRKVEKEEFITAEIENEIKRRLLNNDVFLKELLEKLTEKTEEHIGSGVLHVTTQDKANWNGKAGTSIATQQANGLMSNTDKAKLDGVAANAEVNQNAISSIKVGTTVISSNAKTGQITIVAASNNVTITGDNATKQIKISVTGGNADTLGNHAPSYFAPATHTHNYAGSDSAGGKANSAKVADSVAWGNVSSKPSSYPPSGHNHDDRYYTETEMNNKLNGKSDTNHNHDSVYSKATNVKNGAGSNAVTEGAGNTASAYGTHAEGSNTKATADCAHAEGMNTTASHLYTHAEGSNTTASSNNAHAEGMETVASGSCSHAENYHTTARGSCSHAAGDNTIATGECSFAIGKYNKDPATLNSFHSPFIIGKGSNDANRANAFRVQGTGVVYSTGAYNTTGADYAEYFEWLDKNTLNEDRVGYFVTLDGEKIRIATEEDDYILGIVSATPSVIGNSYDDQWIGREIRDEWGRIIYEEVEIEEERDEEGNVIQEAHKEMQPKLNKDYDNTKEYIGRSQRKEWDAIGMLGQLLVRDDGTCKVNEYCKCGKEGVATAAETGYRVLARISDNIIKVLFR